MCTLVVCVNVWPSCPLVIAANRDESLSRPASGPRWWPGEPFYAPRDELAHGTWLGFTRAGMFVGLTNRFPPNNDVTRESRGQLVLEALRAESPSALHASLSTLSPKRFNAFHLLYANAHHAFVTWCDGATVFQRELGPGRHIVTERSLGGDDRARTSLIEEHWRTVSPGGAAPTFEALRGLLSLTRPDDPVGGVCVAVPALNYGTRSSLIYLGEPTPRVYWAEGRPDQVAFEDRSADFATTTSKHSR